MNVRLSQINVYPIKSCKGISVTAWDLEPRGLKYDRRWMLVDDEGIFLTQREFPRMTHIAVEINSDRLQVKAPGVGSIEIPFNLPSAEDVPVVVWDDTVNAVSAGLEAAEWFSDYMGISCELVAMTDRSVRPVNPAYAIQNDVVSFADGYPLMLISENSLADLNSRLATPITMNRFRPNLVVEGCDAYAEDSWKEIKIGDVSMHVVKPCARCTIPTVDPETATKGQEPLRTLSTYRLVDNQVLFGQNIIPSHPGTLRVGDQVEIRSFKR